MISLGFGLVAAAAWGLHDLLVRLITRKTAAMSALIVVLVMGAAVLVPLSVIFGDWGRMTPRAYGLGALSGLAYLLGGVGLYNAFAIGPVRLVAPIAGAYPVLSVGWAAMNGQAISLWQWLAVAAIVAGVAVVAFWAADHEDGDVQGPPRRAAAMGWAAAGAIGFALTFAIGHEATLAGSELPVLFVGRVISAICLALILVLFRSPWRLSRAQLPLLGGMAALDVTALGFVMAAAHQAHPEFAAVASSVFGIVTIILAWRFLREPMTAGQWLGVVAVFAGIGYLAA